jgi:type VI secretion system secreted protein Hcp
MLWNEERRDGIGRHTLADFLSVCSNLADRASAKTPMNIRPIRFLIALFLASAGLAFAADDATFFFVRIEPQPGQPLPGESTVAGHVNESDVLAYSWGASNSSSTQSGGGGGAGKATIQDLSFTKFVDGISPSLFVACASGQRFDNVVLKGTRRGPGNSLQDHLTMKLTNVMVSAISMGGNAGGARQTENITLNFARVELTVRKLNPDGSLGARSPLPGTWRPTRRSASVARSPSNAAVDSRRGARIHRTPRFAPAPLADAPVPGGGEPFPGFRLRGG